MQRVNLPDDKPGAVAIARQRLHGGVRQDGCAACGARAAPCNPRARSSTCTWWQPPGRRAHSGLGQTRADRPGARAGGSITLNHDGGRWLSLGLPGDSARRRARGERPMAAPAVAAPYRVLARTGARRWPEVACTGHAQEVPPPAYQLAAQRAGIPSTVLYAVALQESGLRRNGRIVPWPWSLNVAGQSAASPRGPMPARACSRRCAPRRTRASTRAWARSTSATTSTASPARATCWTRTATSPSPPRS